MPLPVSLICAKCNRDGLHQWLGSKWFSLCCRVEWSSKAAVTTILSFAELNAHRRTGGGYHAVSRYARLRR